MEQKAGAQISKRAFYQSLIIIFILMMAAGILTLVIPSGQYSRIEVEGRKVIDPDSYQLTAKPDYPIWRWFTAPIEVLGSDNGLTIIIIIIMLIFAGAAFAVMDKTGTMQAFISGTVRRFRDRKYQLIWMVSLAFMFLGAFLGTFEEVIMLVPVMIALSYFLGWDALVGLGMSILATNIGFSAAIMNPYTVGIAQQFAGLPIFSGAWFRIIIFIVFYVVLGLFLSGYAHKIDRDPKASMIFGEDAADREKYKDIDEALVKVDTKQKRAIFFFGFFILLIFATMIASPFVPVLSSYGLLIIGFLFLIGGLGAGFLSGAGGNIVWRGLIEGVIGLIPTIPIILMASSIRFIIDSGGVTDTILHAAAQPFAQLGPFPAALIVYGLALCLEFFIASGSAKAFLMMPLLLPLSDIVGVTRQTTILAYVFGDGFSNLMYPTNPVLLICLGLTVVSFPKWIRWSVKLWAWIILVSIVFLAIATAIHLGPF